MGDMRDLQSFLDDDGITTPPLKSKKHPEGKQYRIESPDAETGLRLAGLANVATRAASGAEVDPEELRGLVMGDEEERSFMKQVLGTAYDEMVEDGVSWVTMQRLNQYAFAYFAVSPAAADRGVETGAFAGKKAPAPPRKKTSTAAKSAQPGSAGSNKKKTKKN